MESGSDGLAERRKVRVMIVDDQVSVREMVAMALNRGDRYAVVAETASGIDGLRLFRKHEPGLVITALALPEMNGPEMIQAIREEAPASRVLVFSGSRNRQLVLGALESGAHGFVHKTEPLATLQLALGAVVDGFHFFCPYAAGLLDEARRRRRSTDDLTPQQRTVLKMVAEGMSTKQVAGRLSLSPKTVEHYRTQLMRRLGLRDVASLTRYAIGCGLVGTE